MATFNEEEIFGPCPIMTHDDPPNAAQVTHYPGVWGVERLDLAPGESFTNVKGVLVGDTVDDLGAACAAIRTMKLNGQTGTLVDTDGETWEDAVLIKFRTTSKSDWAPGWGWCRDYEMTFLHLNNGQAPAEDDQGTSGG